MQMTTYPKRTRGAEGEREHWLPLYSASEGGQKQAPKKGGDENGNEKGAGPQKLAKKGEKLKSEMDALVDEIDEVLEENAEEFVKNYVQRGGE
jgi:prokaryotic ubiquitin-like protein Pup